MEIWPTRLWRPAERTQGRKTALSPPEQLAEQLNDPLPSPEGASPWDSFTRPEIALRVRWKPKDAPPRPIPRFQARQSQSKNSDRQGLPLDHSRAACDFDSHYRPRYFEGAEETNQSWESLYCGTPGLLGPNSLQRGDVPNSRPEAYSHPTAWPVSSVIWSHRHTQMMVALQHQGRGQAYIDERGSQFPLMSALMRHMARPMKATSVQPRSVWGCYSGSPWPCWRDHGIRGQPELSRATHEACAEWSARTRLSLPSSHEAYLQAGQDHAAQMSGQDPPTDLGVHTTSPPSVKPTSQSGSVISSAGQHGPF